MKQPNAARKELIDYDAQKVDEFIDYVNILKTDKKKGALKNEWATKKSDEYFISLFKKVARFGIFIDGDSVSITVRGLTYDYNAYKNVLLYKYPETTFDIQLVYDKDTFVFEKENGKIWYKHTIKSAFDTSRKIVGAYAIIKNRTGEHFDSIDIDDINKFKNASMMKYIWDTWFDRMVLKSIIKRICKKSFYDVVSEIDKDDNEHNEPDNALIPSDLQEKIENSKTIKELEANWKLEYNKDRSIRMLFTKRRKEIESNPETKFEIAEKGLNIAIGNIITGELDKDEFLAKYHLTDTQKVYFENSINGK